MKTLKLLGRNYLFWAGLYYCNSVSLPVHLFFLGAGTLLYLAEYKYVYVPCLCSAVNDLTCCSPLMTWLNYFQDVRHSHHSLNCFADHQKPYLEHYLQGQHRKEGVFLYILCLFNYQNSSQCFNFLKCMYHQDDTPLYSI